MRLCCCLQGMSHAQHQGLGLAALPRYIQCSIYVPSNRPACTASALSRVMSVSAARQPRSTLLLKASAGQGGADCKLPPVRSDQARWHLLPARCPCGLDPCPLVPRAGAGCYRHAQTRAVPVQHICCTDTARTRAGWYQSYQKRMLHSEPADVATVHGRHARGRRVVPACDGWCQHARAQLCCCAQGAHRRQRVCATLRSMADNTTACTARFPRQSRRTRAFLRIIASIFLSPSA